MNASGRGAANHDGDAVETRVLVTGHGAFMMRPL
jgi:hypothetical protein